MFFRHDNGKVFDEWVFNFKGAAPTNAKRGGYGIKAKVPFIL